MIQKKDQLNEKCNNKKKYDNGSIKKSQLKMPWPGGSVGWSIVLFTKRLQVQFPVKAHTQVVGSIPSWGVIRRQPIDVSLPLSLSLSPLFPLSLKNINKHILKRGFFKNQLKIQQMEVNVRFRVYPQEGDMMNVGKTFVRADEIQTQRRPAF